MVVLEIHNKNKQATVILGSLEYLLSWRNVIVCSFPGQNESCHLNYVIALCSWCIIFSQHETQKSTCN